MTRFAGRRVVTLFVAQRFNECALICGLTHGRESDFQKRRRRCVAKLLQNDEIFTSRDGLVVFNGFIAKPILHRG